MNPGHFIAIFGGAVAGSEAAAELAGQNAKVVVFEQNELPYGKLESGLPKWHDKLRDRQEAMIDEKLNHPNIYFVPNIKLGRELDLKEVVENWGFTVVLLATGAWRDRPLPVPDIEKYVNKGFYYQNPFVHWFNRNHDPDYDGPQYHVPDGTIIIGGGLASLDMGKIVMMEITQNALRERGIETDIFTMERQGIPAILDQHGLDLPKLGIRGCTLYTRHSVGDMPLTVIPDDATPEQIEKAHAGRKKILSKIQEKFPFKLQPGRIAVRTIGENGRLKGMIFQKAHEENGRYSPVPGSDEEVLTSLVISAIGSIPEDIPGIPLQGEIYEVENTNSGKLKAFENVYALGNAVTGRGNIRQSQLHSRQVTENIRDEFLAYTDEDYREIFDSAAARVDNRVQFISERIKEMKMLSGERVAALINKVKIMQAKAGYDGDYKKWIKSHLPVRLEDMLEEK